MSPREKIEALQKRYAAMPANSVREEQLWCGAVYGLELALRCLPQPRRKAPAKPKKRGAK